MLISILILSIGFIFFIYEDVMAFLKRLQSGEIFEKIADTINSKTKGKKVKIKKYISRELQNEKESIIVRSYTEMQDNLNNMGDSKYVKTYNFVFALFGVAGVFVALYMKNMFLVPVFGLGFALVPTWFVRLRGYKYRKEVNAELSVSLSAVTTSYIRSNNLIKAIEENIGSMEKPVSVVFREFLNRYNFIDKNIKNNIEILSNQFDNRIFKLWCQELTVCQDDNNYKNNLQVVVAQFALDKEVQDNLSVKMKSPIKETLSIIAITLLLYPLLAFFGNGTLEVLTETFIGQALTSTLWLVNFYAIDKATRLSAPVE